MARYAVVDIGGGGVLGIVDAAGPEEACQAIDAQRGACGRGYARYGAQSGMAGTGRPGAYVHKVPADFAPGTDPVRAIRSHPCIAIVLTSEFAGTELRTPPNG